MPILPETLALRLEAIIQYGGACVACGEDNPELLQFHHIHGGGNGHRRQLKREGKRFYVYLRDGGYRDETIELRCANCHVHATRQAMMDDPPVETPKPGTFPVAKKRSIMTDKEGRSSVQLNPRVDVSTYETLEKFVMEWDLTQGKVIDRIVTEWQADELAREARLIDLIDQGFTRVMQGLHDLRTTRSPIPETAASTFPWSDPAQMDAWAAFQAQQMADVQHAHTAPQEATSLRPTSWLRRWFFRS